MNEKAEIRQFVEGLLARDGDDSPLTDGDSLLVSGRLQSIDAVEIVMFLEQSFGLDFATIGFDRDRLDSIDAIALLVESSKSGQKRSE
jgi:acyl carrier protein